MNRDEIALHIYTSGRPHWGIDESFRLADQFLKEAEQHKEIHAIFVFGNSVPQTKTNQPKMPASCGHEPRHRFKGVPQMAFAIKDTDQISVPLKFLDGRGKEIPKDQIKLDGKPTWASSDPAKVSATPSEDGMSCTFVALGNPGDQVSVTMTCDADLGPGVREVKAMGDILIVGGDIAVANIDFANGKVTPQPPVAQ